MSRANRSARRSGRVESPATVLAGQGGAGITSAPESMAPPVSRMGSAERRRRVSAERLRRIDGELSARDRAILQSVADYGFLTTAHIQSLHFYDHATSEAAARICRRVLARLHRLAVIEPLQRRIGGIRAGSASFVWRVGPVGDRLLRQGSEQPRARRKEPSTRFLDHRLAVADCACLLTTAARQRDFELVSIASEPSSWRPFLGLHGAREILKPDLHVVTASGEFEDHWFIEIDRGTESLPTVLKQCAQYERYRRSGREQAEAGVFPRVVWLVPEVYRRDRLTDTIRAARDLDAALFRVALPDDLLPLVVGGAS